MKPFILVEPADRDLSDIWEYIARDSMNAADRVMLDLESAMNRLAEIPNLGHRHPSLSDRYLCWRVYSYLIIYRPDTSPLQIIRIVHGSRDLPNVVER